MSGLLTTVSLRRLVGHARSVNQTGFHLPFTVGNPAQLPRICPGIGNLATRPNVTYRCLCSGAEGHRELLIIPYSGFADLQEDKATVLWGLIAFSSKGHTNDVLICGPENILA